MVAPIGRVDLVKITEKLVRIRRVRIGLKRRSISSIWVATGSPKENSFKHYKPESL